MRKLEYIKDESNIAYSDYILARVSDIDINNELKNYSIKVPFLSITPDDGANDFVICKGGSIVATHNIKKESIDKDLQTYLGFYFSKTEETDIIDRANECLSCQ